MTAEEFLKQYARMCQNTEPQNCPIYQYIKQTHGKCNGEYCDFCIQTLQEHPSKCVAKVQLWNYGHKEP